MELVILLPLSHLSILKVPPHDSFAADGLASMIQQTQREQSQADD